MTAEQTPRQPMVGPIPALLLSILVLPGLGQLLTGRMARGAIMAGAIALWMPVAVIKAGRDLSTVLPPLAERANAGELLTFTDLQTAMAPMADGLTWLFMPLLVIWFWTLADSIKYALQNRNPA
ncbi:hypothetical protein C4J81_13390 [Deltaproteobacteria bacterium Smac51]|nr:hypothetical protein C4J81_13390 [Deltaproteobacteria bacterium Smac51]